MPDVDAENMIGVIDGFSSQIEEALNLDSVKVLGEVSEVVVAGMGGSGHPGDMLKAYLCNINSKIPVFVVRDYNLPAFVSSRTLVFAMSYSGNTEETVSALKSALAKGAKVVVVTSGGRLREIAEEKKIPFVLVPSGIQPRLAVGYMFVPLLMTLSKSGVIKDPISEVRKAAERIADLKSKGQAKSLAAKLIGKIPLIYSSERLHIAAYIWKILINECAKTHAFSNVLPELDHNEINAYKNFAAKYYVVFLQDEAESRQLAERFSVTRDIISKSGVECTQIVLKGDSFLTKLFVALHTGMYVSYYLALGYGTDPTPVPVIEELKARLKRKLGQ